ncbi:thermonuclease family protein [Salinicoccus sp. HZC-1]|uniref:thermonuclease family protein n=1 Tax=Salinicoccus sp. HZC-1 TaxID=3385497 RepID=UPI00398B7EB6
MSILLYLLSFSAGIGVLITFIIGLANYFSSADYKKWWRISLGLFAAASVLTLLASIFDSDSGLNTGLAFLWVYVSLLMFAYILVYIIKRVKKDSTKGYKKRIATTFIIVLALIFTIGATAGDPENAEREINEATATVEEETKEQTTEETTANDEKEPEAERAALDAKRAEIEERKKLEEEKSVEQKQKEDAQKESEQEEAEKKEAELKKKKEEKPAEEKSTEEKSAEEKKNKGESKTEEESAEEPEEEKTYEPGSEDRIPVTVASFTDGDTTRFYYNGNDEPFRYLLIDTPETSHPRVGEQPFGKEASARTKELLSNADVIEVEFDVGARQDHYQRNLAYVYADGQMVNEILVREGLAQVNYVEPPNIRHLERLQTAQALAKQEQIGIWSLPHPFDSEIYQEGSSQESPDSDSEENNSSTRSSEGTEHFQNCTELREVYPDGVASDHPAYQSKMDRDKDDYACE